MSTTLPSLQRKYSAAPFIDFNATTRAASVNECDIFLTFFSVIGGGWLVRARNLRTP